MENKYSNVCRKIIEHYSNYLSEKEILALKKIIKLDNYDNLNIIIFINKIIDRIWQMTLTTPINFQQGKQFSFLTTRDLIPIPDNLNALEDLTKFKIHTLSLVTQNNVIELDSILSGIIVEIDFTNQLSELILPIDFEEKKDIAIRSKLNIKGVYNISLGINEYDAIEQNSNSFANLAYLPKINIIKPIYNLEKNQIILDSRDKESITEEIINYYLLTNNYDKNIDIFNIKTTLIKKYKNKIINRYLKYFKKEISLEEFINYVFKLLDNSIKFHQVDKKM